MSAVGIDIGGTKMAVAAVDATGQVRARVVLATEPERGFPVGVARLCAAVRQVAAEAGWQPADLRGIGIGCTGPVNPFRGTLHNPYTLPGWDNCDLVTPLQECFGVPVRLENDADAAALGECFAGAGRGFDPVVMLTFGTGIGGAAIVGGAVFRGVAGEHPEIGHVPVRADGPACYCGTAGCLEAVASGSAIAAAGRAAGFADCPTVFRAAAQGAERARAIVEAAVQATAWAAWTLVHTFMPQRIILGGGIMDEHFDLFAAAASEQLRKATLVPRGAVSVAQAALGNDAGVVGAACMVTR